jgi:tryptophanyl-tRNA synthetase
VNTSSWKSIAQLCPQSQLSNKPETNRFCSLPICIDYTNKEWRITKNKYLQYSRSMACLRIDVKVFYRQSDVPQTAELSWYLSFFPFND